jgi:hypothetical protein
MWKTSKPGLRGISPLQLTERHLTSHRFGQILMRMRSRFAVLLFASLLSFAGPAAAESHYTCAKDGKALEVKGTNVDQQKKDCARQGGVWEDKKDAKMPAPQPEPPQKQSPGSGAGW